MRGRINQPKVFLSHSSLDKPFIERVAKDLDRYKIDYWLDTEEIRDGRPWLKVIFEDGIATCDAVLVYLTENSLNSKMVEKEMDATLVEQLGESNISILPYVSKTDLRRRLRPDIRSLHCREWNEENYSEVLPSVVAEIWRSYLERIVHTTTLLEKSRRLEVELELKNLQERHEGTVFTPSEEREFSHIQQKLDRDINLHYELFKKAGGGRKDIKVGKEVYRTNLLSALIYFVGKGHHRFTKYSIEHLLFEELGAKHPSTVSRHYPDSIKENLVLELQTYGLDKFIQVDTHDPAVSTCEFTEKMYRFAYWLDYNRYSPELRFELVSHTEDATPEVPEPKNEIPASKTIKQIDQILNFKARRNRWRTSEEGVADAQREFESLCEELERKSEKSNSMSETFKIDFRREGRNQCRVSGLGVILSVTWKCEQTETLEGSALIISASKTEFDVEGVQSFTEQGKHYSGELNFDVDSEFKVVWRRSGDRESLTTVELADELLSDLIRWIHNRVAQGK